MTEPKEALEPAAPGEPGGELAREPAVIWPELPSGLPRATGPEIRDPAVDALLERLGTLASTPVSGHGEAYAALHDGLLEALNEDVAGQAPAGQTTAAQTHDSSRDRGTPHDDQA